MGTDNIKNTPWQLKLFKKTLKKQQRLKALRSALDPITPDDKCLLVTCGDNNGAMNYLLRELGGEWSFADLEDVCLAEMRDLLGQDVAFVPDQRLPFADSFFDKVVTIDVHEHLDDARVFSEEVSRVVKPGGQVVVTVPNGDENKVGVKIKSLVGMSPEEYGHSRVGLTVTEVQDLLKEHNIEPTRHSTFSKFFTEMLELTINWAYVKVLSKKSAAPVEEGQIAPATSNQLRSVGKSYKIYSLIYPVYWVISQLDRLLPFLEGYVVVVEGRRVALESLSQPGCTN